MLFIFFSFLFAIQGVGSAFEKRIKNGETIPEADFGCTLCKTLIWCLRFIPMNIRTNKYVFPI